MTRAELMEQLDEAIWEATGDLCGPDDKTRYVTINGDEYIFSVSGKGHDRYKIVRIKRFLVFSIGKDSFQKEVMTEHAGFDRVRYLLQYEGNVPPYAASIDDPDDPEDYRMGHGYGVV